MALQIDIEWPETGNQVGRTFTASGSVWDDSEKAAVRAAPADVECTLTGGGNTYTNKTTITLPGAGATVAWSVPLPTGMGQIAVGTYSLTAVLKLATNPPSDQEDNIQVVAGGPSHPDVQVAIIEE
jgi:hypothetical protein